MLKYHWYLLMKSTDYFFFLTFVLNKFINEYYKFVYLTAKILAYRLETL